MSGSELRGLAIGLVVVAVIGAIDSVTGPDYGFAFFYFVPIVPVAWRVGLAPALVVAVAAAAMWFGADALQRPAQAVLPSAWNALSRLAIFLAGAWLIDRVRRDRERMAVVDAWRDDFLRVLERELPTPAQEMVSVLSGAGARGSLDPAAIDALRHRAESLLFLTRDFVALGQAQARRLPMRVATVDIAQLVTEIARDHPDHGSVLVTVPGEGLLVSADADRLRQAVGIVVARVVAGAGAVDYVSITVRSREGQALVAVSAAMPASATRAISGRDDGIGLQLARLLVEAMEGSLEVEREAIGRGTRVTLRVPLAPGAPAAAAPALDATARR